MWRAGNKTVVEGQSCATYTRVPPSIIEAIIVWIVVIVRSAGCILHLPWEKVSHQRHRGGARCRMVKKGEKRSTEIQVRISSSRKDKVVVQAQIDRINSRRCFLSRSEGKGVADSNQGEPSAGEMRNARALILVSVIVQIPYRYHRRPEGMKVAQGRGGEVQCMRRGTMVNGFRIPSTSVVWALSQDGDVRTFLGDGKGLSGPATPVETKLSARTTTYQPKF